MSKADFELQMKRGKVGEDIVGAYLKQQGYIPYKPDVQDKAHPFDFTCASPDKRTLFIADVKTKPRRLYYPDTGIDERHYADYQHISKTYQVDVFIFFVDEHEKRVYGNYLTLLAKPTNIEHKNRALIYPIREKGIIYFPLANMVQVATLNESQLAQIKQLKTLRTYEYKP